MTTRHFDSNVLIDYQAGIPEAIAAIDACDRPVISKIVHIEVMVGCKYDKTVPKLVDGRTPDEKDVNFSTLVAAAEARTLAWISSTFTVLPISDAIADFSVQVRKQTNQALPDTIVHATAMMAGKNIITRNVSDFPALMLPPAGYRNILVISPYGNPHP